MAAKGITITFISETSSLETNPSLHVEKPQQFPQMCVGYGPWVFLSCSLQQIHVLFLKNYLVESKGGRQKVLTICWFMPQMPTTARAGSALSQEPGTQPSRDPGT